MPVLVACGRQWSLALDDLLLPALVLCVVNVSWFCLFIALLYYDAPIWSDLLSMEGFLLFLWIFLLLCVVACQAAIAHFSSKGSLLDDTGRRLMVQLLCPVSVLSLMQLIASFCCILCFIRAGFRALQALFKIALFGNVGWQLFAAVYLISIVRLCWDTRQTLRFSDYRPRFTVVNLSAANDKFENSVRCSNSALDDLLLWSVLFSFNKKAAFLEIANLFAYFFVDFDLVASDLVAGLCLLNKKQQLEESHGADSFAAGGGSSHTDLRLADPGNRQLIAAFRYYLQYLSAIYASLAADRSCHHLREAELRKRLPSANVDILYASCTAQCAFAMALDHNKRSLLICVVASSLKRFLKDIVCNAEETVLNATRLELTGHKGSVDAAWKILGIIEQNSLFESAYKLCHSNYALMLVGHSFGAGVATILGFLLRDRFPDLHVLSFSPSGSLLSWPAAQLSQQFVSSVTFGADFAIRTGLAQVELLRSGLWKELQNCKQSKWKLFTGLDRRDLPMNANPKSAIHNINSFGSACLHSKPKYFAQSLQFPPGKIIRISNFESGCCKDSKLESKLMARYEENDSFRELLIRPTMIGDHSHLCLEQALQWLLDEQRSEVVEQYNIADSYLFKQMPYGQRGGPAPIASPDNDELTASLSLLDSARLPLKRASPRPAVPLVRVSVTSVDESSAGDHLAVGTPSNQTLNDVSSGAWQDTSPLTDDTHFYADLSHGVCSPIAEESWPSSK